MTDFDCEFEEWMSALGPGTSFRRGDDSLEMLMNNSEEIYSFAALPDGWVRLHHVIRGAEADWELDAATTPIAEAYLSVRYANTVRGNLGLPSLDLRERVGADSARVVRRESEWIGPDAENRPPRMDVLISEGRELARFELGAAGADDFIYGIDFAASATWYIDRPLDEVLASLRHPTGAPLFELLGDRRA
jgi:hypothetical protein